MKEATLNRTYLPTQTLGKFIACDHTGKVIFASDSIELAWKENKSQISCIPAGTYKCVYRESAKYPQHYHVLDVPGREFILIHQANFVGSANPKTHKPDLLGCIGVGNGYADLNGDGIVELLNSTATLRKMIAVMGKEDFELTII